jgi:hypothetical protein
MVMSAKPTFITVEDLIRASLPKFAENIIRKPFEDIISRIQQPQTPTAKPASSSPTPTATATSVSTSPFGNMTFDEAFTRLRMIWASIPAKSRQAMLPVLVERLSRRIADPMEREDFRTIAMSLAEIQQNDDVMQKYLPIILILSLMRGG